MDMLRTCYTSYMRLYPDDPDRLTLGRWAWCPEGAIDLPFEHSFLSSRFDPFSWRADPDIGEVGGIQGYSSGKITPRYTGKHWCGGVILYQEGSPLDLEGTPAVDEEGVPLCCDAPPAVGGLAMGGEGEAFGTGNALWWIAPSGIEGLSDDDPITSWPTISIPENPAVEFTPLQDPAKETDPDNGQAVAVFGSTSELVLSRQLQLGEFSLYVVGRSLSPFGQAGPGLVGSSPYTPFSFRVDKTGVKVGTSTSGLFWPHAVAHVPLSIWGVRRTAGALTLSLDGVEVASGTVHATDVFHLDGLAQSTTSFPLLNTSGMFEVLVFGDVLTDEQQDLILTYLSNKYAIPVEVNGVITGTIVHLATAAVPAGYLACDGAAYLTTDYPALSALLAGAYDTYRGASAPAAGNFRVPDFRGLVLIGGGGAASSPATSARVLGEAAGEEAHTLTGTEMPSHLHGLSIQLDTVFGANAADLVMGNSYSGTDYTGATQPDGGSGAHNNIQPYGVGFPVIKT